jgi:DNA-binding SARP family transcriptional activator
MKICTYQAEGFMLAPVLLSVLGGFRAERSGEPIATFESNKVRALLAYLAVEAGRSHQRSALAGLLWPDHPEELARTNLRHVLRQLRQTLPDQHGAPPILLTTQQTIQINPAGVFTLDVTQFAELLRASARCDHRAFSDCPGCVERYSRAAALYGGPFLANFVLHDSDIFDEWAMTQREQLHRQALEIFFTLASHYEAIAEYDLARQYAWRQIELEPWREEAHRQVMRVLVFSGQRTAALAQYVRCRTILADELGVDPDPETLALYEAIRIGKLAAVPRSPAVVAPTITQAPQPAEVSGNPTVPAALAAPTTGTSVGPLHYLASGHLVGRQRELAQLEQLWDRAQNGQAQLALVVGEPGIGKTRLIQALMAHTQRQGAVVLRGGCYEYEATTPYLPFVECLRAYVHAHDVDTLRAQLGPTAAELVRLAPEIEVKLGVPAPSPSLPPGDERLRLFDNIARFLQSLASDRGLLIFLDDLHWADRSTLVLLHYVLRHLRTNRLLVVVAYREIELDSDHPMIDALAEWNRERLATRIALERLSRAETDELLHGLLDQENRTPAFAEAIYRETEGNPFFVEEVVKALLAQEQLNAASDQQRKGITELEIPQSIKEAIGRRLRRLSQVCGKMLHTAAALGKTFAFAEVALVVPADEDTLLNALDEACVAQLIRPNQADSFTFTHDKIRETLYQELNPIRRRRLHQRIGELLEKLYASDQRDSMEITRDQHQRLQGGEGNRQRSHDHAHVLAFHAVTGHDWQRGLIYSQRAADHARRIFANDEALHYYQMARQCAEELNQPEQLASITELIGDVYTVRGPLQLAVEYYQRTHDLVSSATARAVLKVKIGRVYVSAGDAQALMFLTAALDELDPETQTKELAAALAALGRLHHFWCQHAQAIAFLERARQLVEPFDDIHVWMDIFSHLAGACQHMAQVTQSMDWARQSIALAERHNALQVAGASYDYLAQGAALLGQWQASMAYSTQGRQIAEETSDLVGLAWIAFDRAWSLHGQGLLNQAHDAAHEATARGEELGEQRLVAWAGNMLVLIQADLQLDAAAHATAERMIARADELGQPALRSNSRRSLAYLHVQRQEWPQAAALLDQAIDILSKTDNHCEHLWFLGAHRAEAYLGLGRLDEAMDCITEYLALARRAESRYFEGLALRVQSQILAAHHHAAAAISAVDHAIAALEATDTRLELGRALYQRALIRRRFDRTEAMHQDVKRARELFTACGALRDLERVEAMLHR